jgi:hypothetical protein
MSENITDKDFGALQAEVKILINEVHLLRKEMQQVNADKLKQAKMNQVDSMQPVLYTENLLKEKSNRLKNPIKLQDGSRLSGFTSPSRTHFFGYDKNGEMFSIEAKYVNPDEGIVAFPVKPVEQWS